jgi:hypothetical protein
MEIARDRSHIRVFEAALASKRDDYSEYSERDRREAESERLVTIAKENDLYLTKDEVLNLGERHPKPSGESVVYIDSSSCRVYKVKDPYAKSPMKSGVWPEDIIYEHLVHNLLFPETRYTFEAITEVYG